MLGIGNRGNDGIDASGDEDEVLEATKHRGAKLDGQWSPRGDERFFALAILIFVIVDGILEHDEDDHIHHAHAKEEDQWEEIIEEHKPGECPAEVHIINLG